MRQVRQLLTLALLSTFIFAGWATVSRADIYWEATQKAQGMPGQPDGTQIVKNYLSPKGSRTETQGMVMILDLTQQIMYQIDPQQRTYSEIDLKSMEHPMAGMDADSAQQMQQVMKTMMGTPQVVPTGETRTINGYECQRYRVNFMMTETDYWLSKEIPALQEARELGAQLAEALSRNPMLKQMNIAAMFKDLDGFPVESVVKVMEGRLTTTLTKIEQKALDGELFKVPPDYQKVAPAPR